MLFDGLGYFALLTGKDIFDLTISGDSDGVRSCQCVQSYHVPDNAFGASGALGDA